VSIMLLIRHASIDGLGHHLVGRSDGVSLNERGMQEAQLLASRLAGLAIAAVYSSPRERARETATAIAEPFGLPVQTMSDLDEIDYGEWTGRSFEELRECEDWKFFNAHRTTAQIPGGESMCEFAGRVRRAIGSLREVHPDPCLAVVTHADWIRGAGACCTGLTLDDWKCFAVDPASVSVIQVESWGTTVLGWNDTGCRKQPE
jgi:ribonuclease H / adenosylcobalamin/alpha-ribazole phosphatase